jgi:hypothetical protein
VEGDAPVDVEAHRAGRLDGKGAPLEGRGIRRSHREDPVEGLEGFVGPIGP